MTELIRSHTIRRVQQEATMTEIISVRNEQGKHVRFERRECKKPMGFFVTFPAGHSLRVESLSELERLGLDQTRIIDKETGDEPPAALVAGKKSVAATTTSASRGV